MGDATSRNVLPSSPAADHNSHIAWNQPATPDDKLADNTPSGNPIMKAIKLLALAILVALVLADARAADPVKGYQAKAKVSALFEAYAKWAGDKTMTQPAFNDRMRTHGFDSKRSGNGFYWRGVSLDLGSTTLESFDRRFPRSPWLSHAGNLTGR